MKRAVLTLAYFLITLSLFSTNSVFLSFTSPVSYYRYKTDSSDDWIVQGSNDAIMIDSNTFTISLSHDGSSWSRSKRVDLSRSNDSLTLSYNIVSNNKHVDTIRYSFNGSDEVTNTLTDSLNTSNIVVKAGSEVNITYQYKSSFDIWSKSVTKQIRPYLIKLDSQKLLFKPRLVLSSSLSFLTFARYDFYKGHDIYNAKAITISRPSISYSFECGILHSKRVYSYVEIEEALIKKRETILPDAFLVEHTTISLGLDYKLLSIRKFNFALGSKLGLMVHKNDDLSMESLSFGFRMRFNYDLNDNITISFQGKVTITHLNSKYELYKSYTILVDALSLRLELRM